MAVSQKESPTLANHNSSRLQEAQHTKLHIAAYSSNQDQPQEGQQHKQSAENLAGLDKQNSKPGWKPCSSSNQTTTQAIAGYPHLEQPEGETLE
jgi:hypothetical protein